MNLHKNEHPYEPASSGAQKNSQFKYIEDGGNSQMYSFDDDRYMDWADRERLVRQDVEKLNEYDRMNARRKRLAEERRRAEYENE